MKDIVHYDPVTGEIMQTGRSNLAIPFNGWDVGELCAASPPLGDISHVTHKVDLASLAYHDDLPWLVTVVAKSDGEQRAARVPHIDELRLARNRELQATDAFAMSDRPMPDAEREAWRAYRHALRELGSHGEDLAAWLEEWPLRPDGRDAAALFRARAGGAE